MSSDNPYASNKLSPEAEKQWAVIIHLLAIPFEFFAPLIGYFAFRNDGPFIAHHVKESLNFGLTMALAALVLTVSVVGLLFIWLLPILWVIFRIIAAIKASKGEFYKIPVAIKFFRV